ncbi:MAG: hypothetical protein K1X66_04460 [Verrucomicrobiae bacterium]|nr:hypothetical protein [Verrucomicrobiae bacterium]
MNFVNSPEHWHIILNHIPILGLGFSLFPLIWSLIKKDYLSLRWGLFLVLISTLLTPVIVETGESAEDRLPNTPGVLWDHTAKEQFEIHEKRAEISAYFFYTVFALALVTWFVSASKKKFTFLFASVTACFVSISLILAIWTADAGGKIRHPEFRPTTVNLSPI